MRQASKDRMNITAAAITLYAAACLLHSCRDGMAPRIQASQTNVCQQAYMPTNLLRVEGEGK